MKHMFESIAANLATNALVFLWEKVNETFAGSKTDFEKELIKVIYESLEVYEKTAPKLAPGRIPFHLSQAFLTELLSFRFSKKWRIEEVKRVVEKDARILPPSEEELIKFFEIFDSKLSESEKLIELNIENNYKSEIFRISSSLQELFSELLNKLDYIKDDIKSTIQDSKLSDILKREWNTQIDEITENLRKFKPYTAKERLEQLEKRINENEGFLGQNLKAKFLFLKALCLQEISFTGKENNSSPLFIQAWKLNPSNLEYKIRAALNYVVLNEFEKAENLADEILAGDEFNPNGWLVKSFLPNRSDEFHKKEIPISVRNKFSFQVILGNWLLAKQKIQQVTELTKFGIEIKFDEIEIPEEITFENRQQWIFTAHLCLNLFSEKFPIHSLFVPFPNAKTDKLFEFTNNLLGKIVSALTGSELETKYSSLFLLFYFTNFQKTHDPENVQIMEQFFKNIENKTAFDIFQLVQVLNSVNQDNNRQKVISIIEEFGEEKEWILSYTKSILHHLSGEDEKSWKSFLIYLNSYSLINKEMIYNSIRFLTLMSKDIEISEERLNYIFETCVFEKKDYRNLFLVFAKVHFKQELIEFDVNDTIDSLQANFQEDFLIQILSEILLEGKLYGKVESYLKERVVLKEFTPLLKIYCKALFNTSLKTPKLLKILKNWRLIGEPDHELMRIELSIRLKQRNDLELYEITKTGTNLFPEDEDFLTHYFSVMHFLSKKQEIADNLDLIKTFKFRQESSGITICRALFKSGLIEEARNLLYDFALTKENTSSRKLYFGLSIYSTKKIFSELEKVRLGVYVKIRIKDKIKTFFVKESNQKTSLIQKLIGGKKGAKFTFEKSFSSETYEVEILRIMDKYLALYEEIIEELDSPFSEMPFEKIELEGDFSLESFNEKLIKAFGKREDQRNSVIKEKIEQFTRGKIAFTEIAYQVFDKKSIKAYHTLTSGLEGICFRVLSPIFTPKVIINENSRFILDSTSACLFYELHKNGVLEFKTKFLISGLLRHELVSLIEEIELNPESKMSINISSEEVVPQFYPDDFKKKRLDYFRGFLEWINSNCEIDYVDEKMSLLLELKEAGLEEADDYSFIDHWTLTGRENHILLSHDWFYFKQFGFSEKIISPEAFLHKFHSKHEKEISKLMIGRSYVGINVHHEVLTEEYFKLLKGEKNSLSICLLNLQFSWNPNAKNIEEVLLFLKKSFSPLFIEPSVRREAILGMFSNLLSGMPPNIINHLKTRITSEFKGRSLFEMQIKNGLLKAMYYALGIEEQEAKKSDNP